MCKQKIVPVKGWPQMTSKWYHVRAVLMQNKALQGSLCSTQFSSLNRFLYMKWRRIDRPTDLLSRIFIILKKKKKLFDNFSKSIFWFFSQTCWLLTKNIKHIKMNMSWKVQSDTWQNGWLYDIMFFCIGTGQGKVLIIQMLIWACSWRPITK